MLARLLLNAWPLVICPPRPPKVLGLQAWATAPSLFLIFIFYQQLRSIKQATELPAWSFLPWCRRAEVRFDSHHFYILVMPKEQTPVFPIKLIFPLQIFSNWSWAVARMRTLTSNLHMTTGASVSYSQKQQDAPLITRVERKNKNCGPVYRPR